MSKRGPSLLLEDINAARLGLKRPGGLGENYPRNYPKTNYGTAARGADHHPRGSGRPHRYYLRRHKVPPCKVEEDREDSSRRPDEERALANLGG